MQTAEAVKQYEQQKKILLEGLVHAFSWACCLRLYVLKQKSYLSQFPN